MTIEGQNMTAEQMLESVSTDNGAGAHGDQPAVEPGQPAEAAPVPEGPQFLDLGKYNTHHVKYQANGKEISEPMEMILKRASMGYNFAQRNEGLNKREVDMKAIQEANVGLEKWKQYDEYAKQNPQWAEHVTNSWDNRGQQQAPVEGMDPDNPMTGQMNEMRSTVANLQTQFGEQKAAADEYANQQKSAAEDKQFDGDISAAREQYGKLLDFDTPDVEGKNVEFKVMEYMQEHGIPSFKAALTSLYMDQILTANSQQALEQQAKSKQAQNKNGIIGVSPTPFASQNASTANRPLNYQDASALALAELNG